MHPSKAVLTGDIVKSSFLNKKQLEELLATIKSELKWQKAKSDIYRGDSFHALCEPEEALTLALRLRAIALQYSSQSEGDVIDIRIAIGIGAVEEPVKDIATAQGEAFLLSGRELDELTKTTSRLAIRCAEPKVDTGLEAVAVLADLLIQKLSVKQAQVVAELLSGYTQTEAARKLGKTQSTINKHAQAANWTELDKAIRIYRKLVSLIN